MARGWESKSVEEQMAASAPAEANPEAANDPQKARKLANLKLARAQAARSLAASENPRYREMLEKAVADLDAEIRKLG